MPLAIYIDSYPNEVFKWGFGAGVLGMDDSDQRVGETERALSPGIASVVFPAICGVFGVIILVMLPWLIGAYNYLRGTPSAIDQTILALLGSDLSRLVVLASSIIGVASGLYLSRFVTTKLDFVKKEGEAQLSAKMYLALLSCWTLPLSLITTIPLGGRRYWKCDHLQHGGMILTTTIIACVWSRICLLRSRRHDDLTSI